MTSAEVLPSTRILPKRSGDSHIGRNPRCGVTSKANKELKTIGIVETKDLLVVQ